MSYSSYFVRQKAESKRLLRKHLSVFYVGGKVVLGPAGNQLMESVHRALRTHATCILRKPTPKSNSQFYLFIEIQQFLFLAHNFTQQAIGNYETVTKMVEVTVKWIRNTSLTVEVMSILWCSINVNKKSRS